MALLKLGKRPATGSDRDFLFAKYRTAAPLPRRPKRFGHEGGLPFDGWKTLGNGPDDSVAPGFQGAGNCVFAGACHETMIGLMESGATPSEAASAFTGLTAIQDYAANTGYVLGDDTTDNGTNVRDALSYRRKTGIRDVHGKRHKIGAYVALDPSDLNQLLEATYIFGSISVGYEFPASAMHQFAIGAPWRPVTGSRMDGGHYVPNVADRSMDEGISWGRIQRISAAFIAAFADEAWAFVSLDALKSGVSPEGFDMEQLAADLAAL